MPAPKLPLAAADIRISAGGAVLYQGPMPLRRRRSTTVEGHVMLSPEEAAELRRELERFRDTGEVAMLPPGSAIVTIPAKEATDA